jgi:Ricin-type beta-trefoil lectin domain-like
MYGLRWRARGVYLALLILVSCVLFAAGLAVPAQAVPVWGTIGNWHSGKCLDDPGFSHSFVQYDIWGCNYGSNQEFKALNRRDILYNGNDVTIYQIQNEASHLCLDLWQSSRAWGTPIKQYTCNYSDDAQWWLLFDAGVSGWYELAPLATNFTTCITVTNDSQSNGAKVESWGCRNDTAMWWEPHSFPP